MGPEGSAGNAARSHRSADEQLKPIKGDLRVENVVHDRVGRRIGFSGFGVYATLCRGMSQKTRICRWSIRRIAKHWGCSAKTVGRAIEKLTTLGLVTPIQEKGTSRPVYRVEPVSPLFIGSEALDGPRLAKNDNVVSLREETPRCQRVNVVSTREETPRCQRVNVVSPHDDKPSDQTSEEQTFLTTPGEGKPGDAAAEADQLANEWCLLYRGTAAAHRDAAQVGVMFREWIEKLELAADAIRAELRRPDRDRSEPPWEMKRRVAKPAQKHAGLRAFIRRAQNNELR